MKRIILLVGLILMSFMLLSDKEIEAKANEKVEVVCEYPDDITFDSIYRVDGNKKIFYTEDIKNSITCHDINGNEIDGFVDELFDTEHELDNRRYAFGTYTYNFVFVPNNSGKYKSFSGTITVNLFLKPAEIYVGKNMIVLDSVKNCEYSMDGETWQERPTFRNLSPDTKYKFYQREKDNEDSVVTKKNIYN